ncbi:P-loop containing nucleoside triphosphate hydrolase protein [Pisolithus tinctorius]|nr:P-loop containing nucleoside triphosphate hydrolase protein [Pisolithus tinctorius]
MPALGVAAALLLLGNSEGLPWTMPAWQDITKVFGVPWHTEPDAAPDSPAVHVPTWTTSIAQSVSVYARNLWKKTTLAAQAEYARKGYTDNDAEGRRAWNSWVVANWGPTWKLNRIIDEVLKEAKCGPYDAMARLKQRKFPTLEEAQVPIHAANPLAYKLFGDDAYPDDPNFLATPIKTFIDQLLVITWQRYRKSLTPLTADGANPSIKAIKSYLAHVWSLITILRRYEDAESLDELEDRRKQIVAMLAAAQNDDTKADEIAKLPKALRDALKKLATDSEIREVEQLVQAALENIQSDDVALEIPDGENIDVAWTEGVEELAQLTEDEIWAHLGLKEGKKIPLFQEFTDPDATIEPWSEEGEAWLNDPTTTREPLQARWHQLVGILRMLQRAFDGQPVLLMDGVGIGKTFQVLGFIACLSWFRRHFDTHGKFPGAFANLKWQGKEGNIPDLPFLIICPVSLHHQWQREIERFLQRSSFDILPYIQKFAKRREWWTRVKSQSRQQPHRQIILATDTAVQDDGSAVFLDLIHSVDDEAKCAPVYERNAPKTVFGHEYLGLIIDEAHKARKFNKFHQAILGLHRQSAMIVAMSATPVMTQLQANRLRGLLGGEEKTAERNTETRPVLQQWVPWLRDRFSKHVIRRTLDSLDYRGNKIFGLPPYQEHVMLLELREWERSRLATITEELVHSPSVNTIAGAGKAKWKGDRCSTKLDILAEIVAHHLAADSSPPLNVLDDGITLKVGQSMAVDEPVSKEPDRIIIFSAFPSSNAAIVDVLKLHGVKALELHGKLSPAKRKSVLNEFRRSTREAGARVLILSMVGMDTLWSALEDEQLRGRIYRYPQQKRVHFYRLVARGTPDVFLNNIAFDKGNLHKAFVGMDDQSRKYSMILL